MYLNFKQYNKEKLTPEQLILMIAAKQRDTEVFKNVNIEDLPKDIFTLIKGKKSQNGYEKVRLSKKGKQILEKLEEPNVEEEDIKVFEYLKKVYLSKNKQVGNGAKTKRHICNFRNQTGIDKNKLITLCKTFVNDKENMEYNHKLEYAFYKPPTVFETKFNLNESRLYKYYLNKKKQFDKVFEKWD